MNRLGLRIGLVHLAYAHLNQQQGEEIVEEEEAETYSNRQEAVPRLLLERQLLDGKGRHDEDGQDDQDARHGVALALRSLAIEGSLIVEEIIAQLIFRQVAPVGESLVRLMLRILASMRCWKSSITVVYSDKSFIALIHVLPPGAS